MSDSPNSDEFEFVRLLAQHQRGVYALILATVPNWADAEDILQETNVRLWEQFGQYRSGSDFGAWARTVAKYVVLNYRKKKGRDREQFTDAFIDKIAEENFDSEINQGRHEALSKCLRQLSDRHRDLLHRYYAPNAVASEIAKRLGRSVESVRLTVFRIRRALRDCIDRQVRAQAAP